MGLRMWETFGPITYAIVLRVEFSRDLAPHKPLRTQQLLLGLET